MKVRLSEAARADLFEIGLWVAADSLTASLRLVDQLEAACFDLTDFPDRFPLEPSIGMRKRSLGSYLIFYRVGSNVEVARVLHASRDWQTLLGDGA